MAPTAPWQERRPAPGPLTLEETGRRAGAYCWVESCLFEALGSWATSVDDASAKVLLSAQAREHAWHAELWHERLPTAGHITPESLTRPANAELVAFVTALTELDGEDPTIQRLVGAYRVLIPRMISAYSEHLELTSLVCDGPVIRALRFVLREELEGWSRGEALIQSLLRSEEQVRLAARHQARLEWMIAAGGGVTGVVAAGPRLAGSGSGQA